jgi:hypothetical protein
VLAANRDGVAPRSRSFDDVAQLPHVAGPPVFLQHFAHVRRNVGDRAL